MKNNRTLIEERYADIFQTYIRWRDGWKCITCSRSVSPDNPYAKQIIHAGHYIDRWNKSVKFNEFNVNCQCAICNQKEHNDKSYKEVYKQALIKKYGADVISELNYLKNAYSKISTADMEDLIEIRLNQIKEMRDSWCE